MVFVPKGPIRADVGVTLPDFFWEPFYQLLRQQMLAFQMQAAQEDGAERVRVLHISPAGNRALHKVTAPVLRRFGSDVFEAFSAVLFGPEDFVARTTAQVFLSTLQEAGGSVWADYVANRYAFLGLTDA